MLYTKFLSKNRKEHIMFVLFIKKLFPTSHYHHLPILKYRKCVETLMAEYFKQVSKNVSFVRNK